MSNNLFDEKHPDWHHNALIHHNHDYESNKWESYATGYRIAAEVLARKVLDEMNNRDTLIFPIVFLYRHYLELRFKEIIEQGCLLVDESSNLKKHHDLFELWKEVKRLIATIWPESPPQSFYKVDKVITDFCSVDRLSDGFRYPIKKNGENTLNGIKRINLRNFYEAMQPVVEILEGITFGISVYQDFKWEMIREYKFNYESFYDIS